MRKIVYIHRANFEKRPPVISCVLNLLDIGCEVVLVTTGITEELQNKVVSKGGEVICVDYVMHKSPFELIRNTFNYRKDIQKVLKSYNRNEVMLWVEGNYTITSLFDIFTKFEYVLQIQENDFERHKLPFVNLKRILQNAKLIYMPEYNRAWLYKIKFELDKLPLIMPNKAYLMPSGDEFSDLERKHSEKVKLLKEKKNIIYQGLLCKERDLKPFLRAFADNSTYNIVLIGKDYGVLDEYKQIIPTLIHFDYLPYPDYFIVTKYGDIGIVTYEPDNINTVYCAPNKLYEYSYFGIPLIGNDIPGLSYPINTYKMGVIVDITNELSIQDAVCKIEVNYQDYKSNATRFYNDCDNQKVLNSVLEIL
ncbi:glycosyltransferase family 1 protein [Myroides sp. N17-2]|uniref:glycosyltransferase family 1 protein n=1 Tax=Myroides sp. N17-2 TaxID=2030799 RepID=UPI000EFC6E66|nr:glycosyltransferase family 1 protein [Myroides sp. N17-2]